MWKKKINSARIKTKISEKKQTRVQTSQTLGYKYVESFLFWLHKQDKLWDQMQITTTTTTITTASGYLRGTTWLHWRLKDEDHKEEEQQQRTTQQVAWCWHPYASMVAAPNTTTTNTTEYMPARSEFLVVYISDEDCPSCSSCGVFFLQPAEAITPLLAVRRRVLQFVHSVQVSAAACWAKVKEAGARLWPMSRRNFQGQLLFNATVFEPTAAVQPCQWRSERGWRRQQWRWQ